MKKSERERLDGVNQLIKSSEREWKRVGILIGFREWDKGNVSGLK
jgi:hypothetical protein